MGEDISRLTWQHEGEGMLVVEVHCREATIAGWLFDRVVDLLRALLAAKIRDRGATW